MKSREQFAVSLLSTLTVLSLGIGQCTQAEGAVKEQMPGAPTIAKQPTATDCAPTNRPAVANKPGGCSEPETDR